MKKYRSVERYFKGISEDKNVNHYLFEQAMKYNIPVNVVDELDKYSFTITSILDRSPLFVAVSSSGKSPTFINT